MKKSTKKKVKETIKPIVASLLCVISVILFVIIIPSTIGNFNLDYDIQGVLIAFSWVFSVVTNVIIINYFLIKNKS